MEMEHKKPNFHHWERLVRGFSNHRRIQILDLLERKPELSVAEISEELRIHFKTASEHIRRLAVAGLVIKRSDGHSIRHKLTRSGILVLKFLRTSE